jgi:hypothetical protein
MFDGGDDKSLGPENRRHACVHDFIEASLNAGSIGQVGAHELNPMIDGGRFNGEIHRLTGMDANIRAIRNTGYGFLCIFSVH